jgi:hypothetical protein
MCPNTYMFKVLTMDDINCCEEFHFIFDYRCDTKAKGDENNGKQQQT